MIKLIGIVGYQAYIPKYRLSMKELRSVWQQAAPGIDEKSVPYRDEDSITMGVVAVENLLVNMQIETDKIDAIYFASISSPYIDKPVSTLLVSMLGLKENVFTTDIGGSAQSGAMALINCQRFLGDSDKFGLIIISDCLKSKPGSIMERHFGSGAVALLVGNNNPIADITGSYAYSIEISDRWKGIDQEYKTGDDRFIKQFGYIPAVSNAISGLLEKLGKDINDYTHIIVQQPDGKTPGYIAKSLKFDKSKMNEGNIAKYFGDLGSVSVFMGLAKVLDTAEEGDEILIAAYSSGGCHAIGFKVNSNIENYKSNPPVQYYINNKININYIKYLQYLELI